MEKTATWTWPDRYSDAKLVEITAKDIAYIQSLVVGWDVAELGAPALMSREGDWLYDDFEDEPKKELLLSLFLNAATLDPKENSYLNPLADASLDEDVKTEAVYGIADKALKKTLLSEKTITVNRTKELQTLYDSCWLRPSGFDPKRGFRLADIQSVIDPEKQLSKSDITKQRKHYKGLLFQYLQLFISKATIATGFYNSFDGSTWRAGKDFSIAEERTSCEWYSHFDSDYLSEISEYIDIVAALPKLLKHINANGAKTYQQLVEMFNLNTLFKYDCDNFKRNDIQLEEILLKALAYFPEEKTIATVQDGYPFILLLVRIYNAQGSFKKAEKLLRENNLYLYTENQLDFFCTGPNMYQQIAFYESCICEMDNTGNFDLWRFPDYPKFTDAEMKAFDITGRFMQRDSKEHKAELKKVDQLLAARKTLDFDMRTYLDYEYRDNLDDIYKDLEAKNQRTSLDGIIIAIVGQINLLLDISIDLRNQKK